jgi:hypothetical protein
LRYDGGLDKFLAMQMLDACVPTADGRELVLTRYTQAEPERSLLLDALLAVRAVLLREFNSFEKRMQTTTRRDRGRGC